jgi:hypothetical protein
LLANLYELEEAIHCLSKVWEIINKNLLIHKEKDFWKLIIEYPEYCPNEVQEYLYENHESCQWCKKESIEIMAKYSLEVIKRRSYHQV